VTAAHGSGPTSPLDFEIRPDPEPAEAAALVVALQRAIAEDGPLDAAPVAPRAWCDGDLTEPGAGLSR